MDDQAAKALGRMGVSAANARQRVLEDPILSRAPLVRALGAEASAILDLGRVGRLPGGGVLFKAGQSAASVVLVADGELAVHSEAAPTSPVAVGLPVGEIAGAAAALGELTRQVTITAAQESLVVELPSESLAAAAKASPEVQGVLEAARDRDIGAAGDLADFLDRW